MDEQRPIPSIELTDSPIDAVAVLASVAAPEAGAALLFMGTTRAVTDGRVTESLDYTAYGQMALQEMRKLATEASQRWALCRTAIVHRLGHLEVGEASVAIAVSAPHRQEAFAAGQWLIDTLKQQVPIWKRENWADGTCDWVHPPTESSATETTGRSTQ